MRLWKMVLGVSLAGGFCNVTAWAQPDETPKRFVKPPNEPEPRPGTPQEQIETDLKTLFIVLNSDSVSGGDYFTLPHLISGGRVGFFGLSEWKKHFLAAREKTRFRLDRIETENVKTDTARVNIHYALVPAGDDAPFQNEIETFDLKRERMPLVVDNPERWRIVPPDYEKVRELRPLALGHIAYFGSQRVGTFSQWRSHLSIDQLKQIGLGVLQFTQDYDERYVFQNEFWREAIDPYVKDAALYLIPGTQTPYTFNDNLSDKNEQQINAPASTVLFYEGEAEKLTFRYDGKAAVCFADGHAALVSPEDAKTLIWKP